MTCFSPDEIVDRIRESNKCNQDNFQDKLPPSVQVRDEADVLDYRSTQESCARFVIEHGRISHNHTLGVFTVVGTTGNAHAVRLFPSESCTCSSTGQCYHRLAVRMSIGLDNKQNKSFSITV